MRLTSCFLNSVLLPVFLLLFSISPGWFSGQLYPLLCLRLKFHCCTCTQGHFSFCLYIAWTPQSKKEREDSVVLFLLLVYMCIPSTWAKPNEALKWLNKVALLRFAISNSIQVTYFHIVSVSDSLDMNTDSYYSGPLYRTLRRSLMSM